MNHKYIFIFILLLSRFLLKISTLVALCTTLPYSTASFSPPTTSHSTPPLVSPTNENPPNSQVIIKNGVDLKEGSEVIAVTAGGNFFDLIKGSLMWVDKSYLMFQIVNCRAEVIVITCPRNWGKSINLSMMKKFFSLKVGADGVAEESTKTMAYQYFNDGCVQELSGRMIEVTPKPIISRYHGIIESHLAKYPVIHLNFASVCATKTPNHFMLDVQKAIRDAYMEHRYLEKTWNAAIENPNAADSKSFAEYNLRNFHKYCYSEDEILLDELVLLSSISTLIKQLYHVHNKKVIVFIDEYEGPISNLYFFNFDASSETEKEILKFFKKFMQASFKYNDEIYKVIMTGILRYAESTGLSGLNKFKEFNYLSKHDLYPSYGLTDQEVKKMIRERGCGDEVYRQARQMYDGYRSLGHPESEIYCVTSIVDLINYKEPRSYWTRSGLAENFFALMRFDEFKEKIKTLLIDKSNHIQIPYRLIHNTETSTSSIISKVMNNENQLGSDDVNNVLGILTLMGYFTVKSTSSLKSVSDTTKGSLEEKYVEISIPNQEIRTFVLECVNRIETNRLGKINLHYHELSVIGGTKLRDFAKDNSIAAFYALVTAFSNILSSSPPLADLQTALKKQNTNNIKGGQVQGNEESVRILLTPCFMNVILQEKDLVADYNLIAEYDDRNNVGKIDILLLNRDVITIVELKYADRRNNIRRAMEQALKYTKMGENVTTTIYLAIRVGPNVLEVWSHRKTMEEVRNFLQKSEYDNGFCSEHLKFLENSTSGVFKAKHTYRKRQRKT